MIDTLKSFLLGTKSQAGQTEKPDDLQIAVIALLIRAGTTDADFTDSERETIRRVAGTSFDLSTETLDALIAEAESQEAETLDLHRWTQLIKQAYSEDERIELIEKLWEVVYADGVLDDYEANLLRRVAGLIYVPDRESGKARQRVMARLGLVP